MSFYIQSNDQQIHHQRHKRYAEIVSIFSFCDQTQVGWIQDRQLQSRNKTK